MKASEILVTFQWKFSTSEIKKKINLIYLVYSLLGLYCMNITNNNLMLKTLSLFLALTKSMLLSFEMEID